MVVVLVSVSGLLVTEHLGSGSLAATNTSENGSQDGLPDSTGIPRGPVRDALNQTPRMGLSNLGFDSFSGGSDAHTSLRTTALDSGIRPLLTHT